MDRPGRDWIRRVVFGAVVSALPMFTDVSAQECVPPPQGVVAWWPLDGASGSTTEDRAGQFPGSLTNGPTFVSGKVGGALQLDGANDFVAVSDSDVWAFGTRDFSIELWASFASAASGSVGHPAYIFIGNDEGPGSRQKWFFAWGGGVLNFHINQPSGGAFLVQAAFSPTPGDWYHLAVTRQGQTFTIYVNGAIAGTATSTLVVPNAVAPLTIGQAEQLGFVNGRLDEVTVYDRSLSATEIAALFGAGSGGKCSDVAVHPTRAGNGGPVTMQISGRVFPANSTVHLVRSGYPDVVADTAEVVASSKTLIAELDLTDQPPGEWAISVVPPFGPPIEVSQAFTVEAGGAPAMVAEVVGLPVIRPDRPQHYYIAYSNRGTVDLPGAFLVISGFPPGSDVSPLFASIVGPLSSVTSTAVPASAVSGASGVFVSVLLDGIPPGFNGILPILLTVHDGTPFGLEVNVVMP